MMASVHPAQIQPMMASSSSARCRRKQAKPRRKKELEDGSVPGKLTIGEGKEEDEESGSVGSPAMTTASDDLPEDSPPSDRLTVDEEEDSVVNQGGSESGVDLGSSSIKDEVNPSPSGSIPSSPYSESLSLLGGSSLNGSHHPIACDHCGLTFAHREDLEKHEISHPVPNQSCKICFKQFANVYRLQRHMISHDESAGLRKFKCPDCDKAFKFKHHLKEHVRIHSGEKPFECPNCGKRFSHSGSYSSHMTSKKCLIMNLKLSRGGKNGEAKGTSSSTTASSPQRSLGSNSGFRPMTTTSTTKGQGHRESSGPLMEPTPTTPFPAHPLLTAKLTDTPDNNYRNSPSSDEPQIYPSASPPFLPPGPVNFHPFLAANPYVLNMSNFFNSLSLNSPFRHLGGLDGDEGTSLKKGLSESQGKLNGSLRSRSPVHSHSKSRSRSQSPAREDGDSEDGKREAGERRKRKLSPGEDGDSDKESVGDKVQRILDTVNTNVTRQFFQSRHMKNGYESLEQESPIPLKLEKMDYDHPQHNNNNLKMSNNEEERRKKKNGIEGVAARLELNQKQQKEVEIKKEIKRHDGGGDLLTSGDEDLERHSSSENDFGDSGMGDWILGEHNASGEMSEEGRKVRVRSLFSESQLSVLRHHYGLDPRPRREHLLATAQQLVLPLRVVQVWFQNSRARDRREGRPTQSTNLNGGHHLFTPKTPKVPALSPLPLHHSWTMAPLSPVADLKPHSEQPLDLTTKKSTPSNSPRPSLMGSETQHSIDVEEEPLNLKASPSRSPQGIGSNAADSPTLFRLVNEESPRRKSGSPLALPTSNTSRLARILSQPPNSPSPVSLFSQNNRTNGYDGRTPSPAVSLGPIMTPSLSSMIPVPSSSPHEYGMNGFNHSPLSLLSQGTISENGDYHPLFLGASRPQTKKRKIQKHSALSSPTSNPNSNGQPEEIGQFSCDQCEKTFNKQSSLARHKYEHSGQRPYKCNTCEKAFKHKHHLTEHLRLHTGAKPFQCKKCGKRFSHSGSYSQHMNHRYAYCKPNPNNRN